LIVDKEEEEDFVALLEGEEEGVKLLRKKAHQEFRRALMVDQPGKACLRGIPREERRGGGVSWD
jgi:hypothetical protein